MKKFRAYRVDANGLNQTYWSATHASKVKAHVATKLKDLGYFKTFGEAVAALKITRRPGSDEHAAKIGVEGKVTAWYHPVNETKTA